MDPAAILPARLARAPTPMTGSMPLTVVIPTLREAENLPLIVPRITDVLREADIEGEIIVVDDNSQDGTRDVCRQLADSGHPIRLLVRDTERGLATAVLHGMQAATGDVLVVMDADGSHPPEAIPALIDAVTQGGADFAIGSRYMRGGSTDESWGVLRKLNSRIATLLARPLTSATDPMSGFFAIRADRFASGDGYRPVGYKIGLELIARCNCRDVAEIPIHFRNRIKGESKLNVAEQFNYIRHLKRIYEYRIGRPAKPLMFAAIGVSGMVVDLGLLTLLTAVMPFGAARALAIWVAMTWNFWLNRRITFSYARHGQVGYQYMMFVLACLGGGLVNWGVSVLLQSGIPALAPYPWIAGAVGVVAGAVVNYFLAVRVAFRGY